MSEWFGIKTRVLWNIKKTLEDYGIEVPLPQRIVRIQSDPKKIPEEMMPPEKQIESVINYEERVLS